MAMPIESPGNIVLMLWSLQLRVDRPTLGIALSGCSSEVVNGAGEVNANQDVWFSRVDQTISGHGASARAGLSRFSPRRSASPLRFLSGHEHLPRARQFVINANALHSSPYLLPQRMRIHDLLANSTSPGSPCAVCFSPSPSTFGLAESDLDWKYLPAPGGLYHPIPGEGRCEEHPAN